MIKVEKGQDPYSVIGRYIRDHVSAIEDMIAVIEIDGKISNELFMVDMTVDGYFIWQSDWYEGEETVVLIDFFSVSDACNPKDVQPVVHWIPWDSGSFPDDSGTYIVTAYDGAKERVTFAKFQKRLKRWELTGARAYWRVLAWMPLPPSYKGDET